MPRQTAMAVTAMVNIFWSVEPSMRALFNSVHSYSQSVIEQFQRLFTGQIAIPFCLANSASTNVPSGLHNGYPTFNFFKNTATWLNPFRSTALYPQSVYGLRIKTKRSRILLHSEIKLFIGRLLPNPVQLSGFSGLPNLKTIFPKWEKTTSASSAFATKQPSNGYRVAFQQLMTQQKDWHSFNNKDSRRTPSLNIQQDIIKPVRENKKEKASREHSIK